MSPGGPESKRRALYSTAFVKQLPRGGREHLLKQEGGEDRWQNVIELISAATRSDETGLPGLQVSNEPPGT